jgi:ArsR family metal-binding transcriptional regulator
LICWLIAACVSPNSSAALVKLACLAAASKLRTQARLEGRLGITEFIIQMNYPNLIDVRLIGIIQAGNGLEQPFALALGQQ